VSPLLLAGLLLVGLALIWVVAELVPAAQVRDAVALHHFTVLDEGSVGTATKSLLHLLDAPFFTIWAVALVLFALGRGRPRVALAVALVMSMAPLTAEVLKPLLAHPHVIIDSTHVGAASWPSGHATAAAALALSAVLVAPRHMRPTVAVVGVIFTLAVGVSLLIGAWHMPSDVLGGYVLAGLWTALAVAALRASQRRWPRTVRTPRTEHPA
jgi:membrane-associated phospholipid phosphatase